LAVKLRLRRMGRKKAPLYKLVAADSRAKRDGKFIESLGIYNPVKNSEFTFDEARVMYWLGVGAEPTLTVHNLLSEKGILMKRLLVKRVGAEAAETKMTEWKEAKSVRATKKSSAAPKLSKKAVAKAAKAAVKTEEPKAETAE